ncbi:MAG: hypothetical protein QQW96_03055 [Tychonema bourrellyi B0820]|nr:hypothetical protein [Tychonema bourrellyi B0820]
MTHLGLLYKENRSWKTEVGRRKKAIKSMVSAIKNVLTALAVAISLFEREKSSASSS